MKTIVLDHNTWGKSHWEQDLKFELEVARRAGNMADKKLDEKIASRKDIYFRVYGIDGDCEVDLGYTGSPTSWAQNKNGWKLENLRFEPMLKNKEVK